MTTRDVAGNASTANSEVGTIDMKLEVVQIPVSGVDRAKRFYQSLGWRLDIDLAVSEDFRAVQFTPPHSLCSIRSARVARPLSLAPLSRRIWS
jgi:hypothetical protein